MEILTEIRQCLRRRRRKFSVGSPWVIEGVRARSHTCVQKVCIFYSALGLGVYGCICARSAPQEVVYPAGPRVYTTGVHLRDCGRHGQQDCPFCGPPYASVCPPPPRPVPIPWPKTLPHGPCRAALQMWTPQLEHAHCRLLWLLMRAECQRDPHTAIQTAPTSKAQAMLMALYLYLCRVHVLLQ